MKIAAASSILILVIAAVGVPTNARVVNILDDSPDSSSASPMPQGDPNRYIVVYNDAKGLQQAKSSATQVHVEFPDLNAVAVTIPPQAVAGFQNNPNIGLIEQDVLRFPMGSFRGLSSPKPKINHDNNTTTITRSLIGGGQQIPYGIRLVQADQVPMGSSFVPKICIIDSGYELGHEDLPVASQVTGDSDSGAGNWFEDGSSHGTHVAGTIAAVNNDKGVVGVCPNCRLHIVRVFGDSGTWTYSSSLVTAARKCRDAGANIISMSLGGGMKSGFESNAFDTLFTTNNILSVAAAGNDGSSSLAYPASYRNVMSVAALDDKRVVAGFSQKNSAVDISAPGVRVISTVIMGSEIEASVTAGGSTYEAGNMIGSTPNVLQAQLIDCGLGESVCVGVSGKICLLQRGVNTFAAKVENCHIGGGIGAIVYNNEPGIGTFTLGDTWTIITTAVAVSDQTGSVLKQLVGTVVAVSATTINYAAYDGTSMATPHVSGIAGLVWSYNSGKSAQDIRNALTSTALDLGAAGRDNTYGFGIVHACNAAKALGATGLTCVTPSIPN